MEVYKGCECIFMLIFECVSIKMRVSALCWRWLCVEMRNKDRLTVSCMLTWVCWSIWPLDQLKSPHTACGQTCRTMPSARVGHKHRQNIYWGLWKDYYKWFTDDYP